MRGTLRFLTAVLLAGALCGHARGQTVNQARDEIRKALEDAQFATGFTGLIVLSDELELSSASYRFDNDVDTEITSYALPFQHTFFAEDGEPLHLHVEGAFGYANAAEKTGDLYEGTIPGSETSVKTDWTTYGGLLGIGPEIQIHEGLTLAAIADGGVARIENDTRYGGPGAKVTSQLLDGLAFNWSGYTYTAGGAVRADWTHTLGEEYVFELVGRYDLRWTGTFSTDDDAQEFTTRLQILTVRADLTGPTGLTPFGHPLGWRGVLGYRHFLEEDLFDTRDFYEIGGGLELDLHEALPFGRVVSLNAALILGPAVIGWTAGVSLAF